MYEIDSQLVVSSADSINLCALAAVRFQFTGLAGEGMFQRY